ncbi:unnamed protein product, partial [Rotaria socialis]
FALAKHQPLMLHVDMVMETHVQDRHHMLLVELHMQNPPGQYAVGEHERACAEPELHIADCGCDSASNVEIHCCS